MENHNIVRRIWQYISRTYEFDIVSEKEVQAARIQLLKEHGYDRSDNDIRWSSFNRKLIDFAKHNEWGLYRNTIFEMAEQLRQENRHKDALVQFFQVCYLDLNGPVNCVRHEGFGSNSQDQRFDPRYSFLAPAAVGIIRHLIALLKLDKQTAQNLYMDFNSRIGSNLKLPKSPEKHGQS